MLPGHDPSVEPAIELALPQRARALAFILKEEFNCSFAFYDARTGLPLAGESHSQGTSPPVDAAVLREWANEGLVRVELVDDAFQLSLVLHGPKGPLLIACGRLNSIAGEKDSRRLETARLRNWGQAVADRLRLSENLQAREERHPTGRNEADSLASIDALLRSLRIHQAPAMHLAGILDRALQVGGFQALGWVALDARTPVAYVGKSPLKDADYFRLIHTLAAESDFRPGKPFVCNATVSSSWGSAFPRVSNLAALSVCDAGLVGWVVALNKMKGSTPCAIGPDDVSRLAPFVSLVELHLRSYARYQDVKELLVGLTKSLTAALDAKDSFTYGHSERVARITVELGRELGFAPDDLSDLYLVGLLHDVGNLGIRESVLCKTEELTPEDFDHIKQHVTIGYSILSDLGPVRHLLPGILYHHENYDGSGYPDGLVGEAIPLVARILAVAEACDSMSNKRPYRDALPYRLVEESLVQGSGKQWDPRVIEAFLRCRHRIHTIRQRGVGHSLHVAIDNALGLEAASVSHNGSKEQFI